MIKRRTNVEIIALGFAIVILVGTFLLLLPVSSDHLCVRIVIIYQI